MAHEVKVAWLSRHDMTKEQFTALQQLFKGETIEVVNIPTHWRSSEDVYNDVEYNEIEWRKLLLEYDAVAGVFPPVACEALKYIPGRCDESPRGNPRVYSDEEYVRISKHPVFTPVTTRMWRAGKISIVFHRWIKL